MSDQPQPLPDGWRWATLADLAEVAGGLAKGKKRNSKARLRSVPYLRVANVQRGHIDLTEVKSIEATDQEVQELRLQPGDVLLNEGGDRDKLGRGWVWKGQLPECIHQNHVFRARVRAGAILPELLSHYANSEGQRYFTAQGKQTTNLASISLGKLRGLPVPVPPPAQQAALLLTIDDHFSRLDAATATLERVQRNLERYRASVLKAAVEGRLVPTEAAMAKKEGRTYEPASTLLKRILAERRRRWEEAELAKLTAKGKKPTDDKWKARYEEPAEPDTKGLPELPEGWCWTTIGTAFEVVVGATPSRAVPEYWGGGIPWVSSGEVAFCRISGTRETISTAGLENSSAKLNPPGTVLIGMIGEGRTRGQVAILDIAACNNQNAAAIRVGDACQSPEFAYYYLASQYEKNRRLGAGNNQPALNKSRVQSIPFPLSPGAEQRRIAAAADDLESVTSHTLREVGAALVRITRLRQSILKWAFDGRLVPASS